MKKLLKEISKVKVKVIPVQAVEHLRVMRG
jgi:hypothetical protein